MDRSRLAVVIPCHDEAATLGAVAAGAVRFAVVMVVDDRSSDGSGEVAAAAGAVVIPAAAPGYDGALDTGLRRAFAEGFEYVVTMDADGEHDPATLADFIKLFESGASLICGVRPAPQRAAEHAAAWIGRSRYGVSDLLCGMKGYSREVLGAYISSGAPLLINLAPAVLWLKAGGRAAQTPVLGAPRTGGRPRFGRALAANRAILLALWRALRLRPVPSAPGANQMARSEVASAVGGSP